MTSQEIIREIQETYSEWVEHAPDPSLFVAGILANKIIKLKNDIEYLERRLTHECTRSANR